MPAQQHPLDETARGVFIIAATPFADDGRLDLASADRLIDFYLAAGVHGLTILGMMGEAPKLTDAEGRTFAEHVVRRAGGRVPVVVGVSNPGLGNLAALARHAMDAGAAGVMVAPPPGMNTDERYANYVHAVDRALGGEVPIVLQDYPLATGVHLSVPAFNRLVDELPSIKVLKHEDWPGLAKITRIRAEAGRDGRRRVSILVGNGGLYYDLELARGADGAMTGFAFPEMLVGVHDLFAAGRREEAEALFDAYLPLVRYEQQPGFGLAVRKEILRRRGAIAAAAVRPPGPKLDADDRRELDALLARVARRLEAAGFEPPRPWPAG